MMKKILIIIPARGGSKGIPRKNLRILGDKPLLFYSINSAISLKDYQVDTYVSSDDDEILLMATKFGAKTIRREEIIATDNVTLDPVIFDAYKKILKTEEKSYDLVITLQPTSPLLKHSTLAAAIEVVFQGQLDTLVSGIYDSHLTWLKEENGFIPNYKERLNRQQLPKIYKETGGFVITKSEFVKQNSRFGEIVEIFPLEKKEAIDIDDFDDWSLCEYYLNRKVLLFVVSGYAEIGMGHVYNTLNLANEILNHRIIFLVDSYSDLAYNKILESNYEVYRQQTDNLVYDIDNLKPDIIINDILDTSAEYILALKKMKCKVINFEDLGDGSLHADLVINAMYPEKKIVLNHYYGAKYFILRDEFLYTKDKIFDNENVRKILISFGGVDPNNFTRRVLDIVSPYCQQNNIEINIVTGMGYNYSDELKNSYKNISVKSNIKDISEEILEADIVFTSAGRTTFEVASIGVPCIVLCQNLRETTHFFASEKNGFYNLGLGNTVSDKEIKDAFLEVTNLQLRKLMSHRMLAQKLKKGKSRVFQLINAIINNNYEA